MGILLNGTINQAVLLAGKAEERNFAEEIKYAALNTVVGLAVVFLVLTLIIFIISLFKYISVFQNKFGSKDSDKSENESDAVENELSQFTSQEMDSEELADDHELVAVITAAIHAYMGSDVPADGLVVRSIKRIGRRNRI